MTAPGEPPEAAEQGGLLRPAPRPDRALRIVAVYQLCKVPLLVAIGLGTLRLLRPEVLAWAERLAGTLALRHDRRVLGHVIAMVSGISPRHLRQFAVAAFVFAALYAVEGTGLWMRKRWAEYLTVIATTLFIPVEVFELVRRVTAPRLSALLLNVAVVAFLVWRLRRSESPERA